VDVTESLDVLFHSVDGFYVDAALDMASRTIVPHVLQTLALLDEASAAQRAGVKADDAIGSFFLLSPFFVLYSFVASHVYILFNFLPNPNFPTTKKLQALWTCCSTSAS
jgi:hypothetical protein